MPGSATERQLGEIALLSDPVRRRLYLYVVDQSGDVSREDAARAIGISRAAAAFHLEKLVGERLLDADYRRPPGRSGPGAGRPARVYRGPARDIRIHVPPRDYELLARFLLGGLEAERPGAALERTHRTAREFGVARGAEARHRAGKHPSDGRLRTALRTVLELRGFEPQPAARDELYLRNCPFDALSVDHRELVCPVNLSMMQGVLEGLGASDLDAVLEPKPGMCCVAFKATTGVEPQAEG